MPLFIHQHESYYWLYFDVTVVLVILPGTIQVSDVPDHQAGSKSSSPRCCTHTTETHLTPHQQNEIFCSRTTLCSAQNHGYHILVRSGPHISTLSWCSWVDVSRVHGTNHRQQAASTTVGCTLENDNVICLVKLRHRGGDS